MKKNPKKNEEKAEKILSSRILVTQENPSIKVSNKYMNYAEYQRIERKGSQIEKEKSPVINDNNEVIGEIETIDTYDSTTGVSTREKYETIDSKKSIFNVDTKTVSIGRMQRTVKSTMTKRNELTGNTEKAEYKKDEFGNETYSYMENDRIEKRIIKNARGTTIDIFKDGQPYATYEYDENGKSLIPMEKIEQLPEDYVYSSFREPIPEYYEIVESYNLEETEKSIINGRETILNGIRNKDKAIKTREKSNNGFSNGLENFTVEGSDFLDSLKKAGFTHEGIEGIKLKIKSVNPRSLLGMDKILNKTQEKTIEKRGMDYGEI